MGWGGTQFSSFVFILVFLCLKGVCRNPQIIVHVVELSQMAG